MFEKILKALNRDTKPSRMEEISEIKKIVLGETPESTNKLSHDIIKQINRFIEEEKTKYAFLQEEKHHREIEDAIAGQLLKDEAIKTKSIEDVKKTYNDILERAIKEVEKSSSDSAYNVLIVLGAIKKEFEAV